MTCHTHLSTEATAFPLTPSATVTELSNRRSSNGFTALSALPAMDGEQHEAEQEDEAEAAQDEGDLVAAEQSK